MKLLRKIAPALLLLAACSSSPVEEEESAAEALTHAAERELPWEVSTPEGESVLPNVFYAEASENEQLAATTIDGRHMIDRLVYPTLGNPNLFVRSERGEAFMMVLRVEKSLLAHLAPREVGGGRLRRLELDESDRDRLAFYVVERRARTSATETSGKAPVQPGVHAIRPSAVLVQRVDDDMPAAFRDRYTVRVVFDRAAMKSVPAGLHDVRMEVLRADAVAAHEFQYNALAVLERPTSSIVNVTDTQVTVGSTLEDETLAKLREFVARVNNTTDPRVRDAAFITFNGDLHNGGSPDLIKPWTVATTYQTEAKAIVDTLKELRLPIFLTMGNHDGYASVGHAPAAFDNQVAEALGVSLRDAAEELAPTSEWPGYTWADHRKFLDETVATPGGRHVDVFSGSFTRRVGTTFTKAWLPVPRASRNMVLYDGVHQWQRTYGPTHTSWRYGKSRYVNLNSFDLRQHRRTGWGLYAVNYGGSVSQVQLDWVKRQIEHAESHAEDVVLIAHHDPRGGHRGADYPFYFQQLDYGGMDQSLMNYVVAEIVNPAICQLAPSWAQSYAQKESCLHDGLQEWMRPDPQLDCVGEAKDEHGTCERPWYSGFALLDLIHRSPRVRTMLLGHTHYNSLEVFRSGDPLVPLTTTGLDPAKLAALEIQNPVRRAGADKRALVEREVTALRELDAQGLGMAHRKLEGADRELVILRLTCNADLAAQAHGERSMYGFATLGLSSRPGHDAPQINEVTFFLNVDGRFDEVRRVPVDRTQHVGTADHDDKNPLHGLFHND